MIVSQEVNDRGSATSTHYFLGMALRSQRKTFRPTIWLDDECNGMICENKDDREPERPVGFNGKLKRTNAPQKRSFLSIHFPNKVAEPIIHLID